MKPPSKSLLRFTLLVATLLLTHSSFFWLPPSLACLITFGTVAFLLHGTLRPNSKLFGPITSHTGTEQIHLTIDDGPDPLTTEPLLRLLEQHGVKATFFLIGEEARKHPDLVRAISRAGHTLGNHTQTHPQFNFWHLGPWRTTKEIVSNQATLRELSGTTPRLFRAPVGHSNFFTHPVLKAENLQLIGWSARAYDCSKRPLDSMKYLLNRDLKPGAIILIHESTPHAEEILLHVLTEAKEKGLSFSNRL